MIGIYANHNGDTILLTLVKTEKEADDFMSRDYVLYFADEMENATEDDVIHPEEMFVELFDDNLPF